MKAVKKIKVLHEKWNNGENQIALVYICEKNNPGNWHCEFQVEFGQSSQHQEMMGFVSRLVDFQRGP